MNGIVRSDVAGRGLSFLRTFETGLPFAELSARVIANVVGAFPAAND